MTLSRPLVHHSRCRNILVCIFIFIFIFFCISASTLFSTTTIRRSPATSNSTSYGIIKCFLTAEPASSESSSDMKMKENPTPLIKQEQERDIMTYSSPRSRSRIGRRKLMRMSTEPGSSPPRCTSKCGKCDPCKPVHVAVPPGIPVTTEYYPEAWRCKCGNRLFIP